MFKFTKTGIFVFVNIIIFCLLQIFIHQYSIKSEVNEEMMREVPVEAITDRNFINEEVLDEKVAEKTIIENNEIWQINIPTISLTANISEGTTKEILNQYVGHFENTSKEQGNIGLAAHNRGYEVNYFKDLKLLKKGDEIIYTHNGFEKIYEVEKCRIIKDTEWKYLEEMEDNMLTLITCVENQPEYRRCIQAVEKEEEIY